jgi:DNA (cytosine-5)-methyltransferase 1
LLGQVCEAPEMFDDFQFPEAPKVKRKKLKDFLDSKHVQHEWKSVDTWE